MLSVCVPTFNRLGNLKLCLEALKNQVDPPEFEVVVFDDGSTDGTFEWLHEQGWTFQIKILHGGPNKGFRGSRARNIAAFNAHGDRYVFVDSDVILNQHALRYYGEAHVAQPDAVVVGRYFFMPKIQWNEHYVQMLWMVDSYQELMEKVQTYGMAVTYPDGPAHYGDDLGRRPESDYTLDLTQTRKGAGLGGLSGNVSYPKNLFWEVGGFDEAIVLHGGEDADLGLTVDEHNADWLFHRGIFGFHLWHPRDQEKNWRGVQANIQYIDLKHGVGRYANAQKWTDAMDKSHVGHYHRHMGAVVVKVPQDQTIWVCRPDHMTRLGITDMLWFTRLGFEAADVTSIDQEALEKYEVMGVTREVE